MKRKTREEIREYLIEKANEIIREVRDSGICDEYSEQWLGQNDDFPLMNGEILNVAIELSFQSKEKRVTPKLVLADVRIGELQWYAFDHDDFNSWTEDTYGKGD